MLLRLFVAVVLLCWPLWAVAADWGQVGDGKLPVNLEADRLSYDKASGRYQASGNVQLQQGDLQVVSDLLWWNQLSGDLHAEGNVELTSPDETMRGSKVEYNLQQGTGRVEDGLIFLREQNLYVRGKQIERRGELDYRIVDGTFTTCDGEVPSWKFGADRVDVTVEGYARAKHAVFYLKDIPTFYSPYILYPVKTGRESGLLTPRVGYSKRRGFQLNSAYYQVLGINQDATLYLDVLSEMGLGKGLEYRYIFGKQNAGEARIYHIDVDQVDGEPVNEQRYALQWQHDGQLPGGVRMLADAMYVSADNYFEDFGEVADEYNKDKVQSVFSLSRNWGKYNLVGELKYTQDLENDDPTTLQQLPRISFDASRQRLGESVFYYDFAAEYSNFWRDQTVPSAMKLRGQRLLLRPRLSASLQLFDVLDITPEFSYLERYYGALSDGAKAQQEGVSEFSTRISTKLQRVYEQPIGAIDKLRHSIEPEVIYRYIPELDQSQLPNFDSYDRIVERNRFEYALVQRFTARFDQPQGPPKYRELAYLRLSQNYDLREEAQDANPFSAIRGQLTLLPSETARLELDSTFDIDQGEWSKVAAEASLHDERENRIAVNYRSNRDEEQEYISLKLDFAYLKPFFFKYEKRFDLAESEQLEDVLAVEYRQQCWSALLTYRENDTDQSLMLSFVMKGIGPVGGVSGSLGGI